MQILGYEISKTHLYIIGGLGLGSRVALSLLNQAYEKEDKKKEDKNRFIVNNKNSQDYCLIVNEEGNKTNSLLLDDIEFQIGCDSKEVRLLYLENNTTYIIYGKFIAYNTTWRFQSSKVEYYDKNSCTNINCSNIQSVAFRPNSKFHKNNCGKYEFYEYGTDFDNDGHYDLGDALLDNLLNKTILRGDDSEYTIGLKLDKHTTIKLMK